MRNAVAILLVIGLVAVGLLSLRDLQAGGKDGELLFTTENADLGNVPFDQKAPFRFEMRNVGEGPVRIASPMITAVEGC